jgi:hypothetical protein
MFELRDVGAKPERGEARRATDGQRSADALVAVLYRSVAEESQRLAHVGGVALTLRRERDALSRALQQIEAEISFEEAQLVTDRAPGEAELLSRTPDAAMAGEGVQRPKRLGRRHAHSPSWREEYLHNMKKIIAFCDSDSPLMLAAFSLQA